LDFFKCFPKLNLKSPQATGLVLWFPTAVGNFGGASLRDFSLHQQASGTFVNTPVWAREATVGGALDFERGDSDAVNVTDYALISSLSEFTISFWMNPESNPTTGSQEHPVFCKGDRSGNKEFRVRRITTGLNFHISTTGSDELGGTASWTPTLGQWTLMTVVWDGANITLFVDGVQHTQFSASGTMHDAGVDLRIGSYSDGVRFFDGKMADIRLYNVAKSTAEIWQLYDPATRWQLYFSFIDIGIQASGAITEFLNASGSVTASGVIARDVLTSYVGQIGPTGDPDLEVQTSLSGSITPTGILSALKIILLSVSGSITTTGLIIKDVLTSYVGQIGPDGSSNYQAQTSLSGSITPSGSLQAIKAVLLDLAGSITSGGDVIWQVGKSIAGNVTSAGSIIKDVSTAYIGQTVPTGDPDYNVQTTLSGSVTPTGSTSVLKIILLSISGAITGTGNLIKSVITSYTGQIDSSGNPIANVSTNLSGSIIPSGVLSLISSAITQVEVFFKGMFRGMFRKMR